MNKKIYLSVLIWAVSLSLFATVRATEIESVAGPMGVKVGPEAAAILGDQTITLASAIRHVVEQNRDVLSGAYDVAMADTLLKQFLGQYAWFFSAKAGYKDSINPSALALTQGEKGQSWELSANLARRFSSGTVLALGAGQTRTRTDFMDLTSFMPGLNLFGPDSYWAPSVFVSLTQDLLRNSFGLEQRRSEKMLNNAVLMQKEALIQLLAVISVGVIMEYWSVEIHKGLLDNASLQVEETRKVRDIMAANVKLGMVEDFNVNYYEALLAGAEAGQLQTSQQYRDKVREFLTILNLPENTHILGTAILQNTSPVLPELDKVLETAYARRADWLNARRVFENAQLEETLAAHSRLPSLKAQVSWVSVAIEEELDQAWQKTLSGENPVFEAGLKLEIPWFDSAQAVRERNAAFSKIKAELEMQKTSRKVKDDVLSKLENVETAYKLYQKASLARSQAETAYQKMLRSLRLGRLNASIVKTGLDGMLESRLLELKSLVGYNVALIQLIVAQNLLWEHYGINPEEYIPVWK
jgi:outer membrane protein TolC